MTGNLVAIRPNLNRAGVFTIHPISDITLKVNYSSVWLHTDKDVWMFVTPFELDCNLRQVENIRNGATKSPCISLTGMIRQLNPHRHFDLSANHDSLHMHGLRGHEPMTYTRGLLDPRADLCYHDGELVIHHNGRSVHRGSGAVLHKTNIYLPLAPRWTDAR